MMTASLRATAAAARLKPIFSQRFMPSEQITVGVAAGQDHDGCLVRECADVATEIGDVGVDDARAVSGHTKLDPTAIYNKATR